MSSASRAEHQPPMRRVVPERHQAPVPLYRSAARTGKRAAKDRQTAERRAKPHEVDLAMRLQASQRDLRRRVDGRDALLEMVRAVNGTFEPRTIAELIVERALTWVPAPCWAVVLSDLSGELSVLADRGLTPDMGPDVYSVGRGVVG